MKSLSKKYAINTKYKNNINDNDDEFDNNVLLKCCRMVVFLYL